MNRTYFKAICNCCMHIHTSTTSTFVFLFVSCRNESIFPETQASQHMCFLCRGSGSVLECAVLSLLPYRFTWSEKSSSSALCYLALTVVPAGCDCTSGRLLTATDPSQNQSACCEFVEERYCLCFCCGWLMLRLIHPIHRERETECSHLTAELPRFDNSGRE